jgi:16S rRNA processing protein RimM
VVARAHGIRGELKLSLDHAESDVLTRSSAVQLETGTGLVSYKIARAKAAPPFWIVSLEGLTDRTAAEALHQARVLVPESALPPPEEGEMYLYQLEGASVQSSEGEALGVVEGSFETGANLVLVVRGPKGEYMLPFIEDVIRSFDAEKKLLTVDLLEGLEPS